MLTKIIYFTLGIGAGISCLVYTDKIKQFTGSFAFAESAFGSGGTYTFFKLLGVGLIMLTIMWITGTADRLIPDVLLPTG